MMSGSADASTGYLGNVATSHTTGMDGFPSTISSHWQHEQRTGLGTDGFELQIRTLTRRKMIRACQGHPVEIEYEVGTVPPETLYCCTSPLGLERILRRGTSRIGPCESPSYRLHRHGTVRLRKTPVGHPDYVEGAFGQDVQGRDGVPPFR